jgi:hypothetical protein
MKAKLKRVSNKLGADGVTRAKLKKQGAITFDELSKIISTGETSVVVLDLTGKPTTVVADALGTKKRAKSRKVSEKLTKFERSLRTFMEANDIDTDELTGVAFFVGENCSLDGDSQPKYYKPKTMGG